MLSYLFLPAGPGLLTSAPRAPATRAHIERCITACAAARDGRGRWRQTNALFCELERAGASPEIALATAMAAERFGAWLHSAAERARTPPGLHDMTLRAEWAQARVLA